MAASELGEAASELPVSLISGDGLTTVQVPLRAARACRALECIEVGGGGVPLPNVDTDTLLRLGAFLGGTATAADFVAGLEVEPLFQVAQAANFVGHDPLVQAACRQIAGLLNACESAEEVRARFGIRNDLTEEERAQIMAENEWLATVEGLQ